MKRLMQYGAYPVVMTVCVAFHFVLIDRDVGSLMAAYVPVTLGALLVTLLELYLPYRRAWRPSPGEVAHDSLFLTTVQVLLPKCLSFAAVLVIFHWLQGETWSLRAWWPSYWRVGWQAWWMVVLADGMRYWLHRLSHEWEPFWRFHAVHHAPHKLYWLNVGRFHPIDKALQFLFDSVPFIVLGVGEDVLSLYFVGYAVNGFFQHCNIDVRLGLLNYLISGPELHRWHHSMVKDESNRNYGNNLIIWDLVFGSRYLPADQEVETLGLVNRRYPEGFMDQMAAPFTRHLDQRAA